MKSYFDLKADGGSGVLEQVLEQRRKVQSNLASLTGVLAIGSGKGGVGKSTLTMLMALQFRSMGFSPAVLDADFNGPCQARLGGLSISVPIPGPRGMEVPVTRLGVGVVSFGTLIPEPQPVDFPTVSQGDSFTWRATREFSVLGELLRGADFSPFDLLLLDLPPGAERSVQYAEFLGDVADFVLVTIPSGMSQGVVARSVSALKRTSSRLLGFIENMQGYYCAKCGEVKPLFPSAAELDSELPCLGGIPFDPHLANLADSEISVTGPVAEALTSICGSLLQSMERRP